MIVIELILVFTNFFSVDEYLFDKNLNQSCIQCIISKTDSSLTTSFCVLALGPTRSVAQIITYFGLVVLLGHTSSVGQIIQLLWTYCVVRAHP